MIKHTFHNLRNKSYKVTGTLVANFTLDYVGLMNHETDHMDEQELFDLFIEDALKNSTNGHINIKWTVEVLGQRFKPEFIPGQKDCENDFLDYFSHPIDSETFQPIEWSKLEIKGSRSVWEGDYIEKVTGWIPDLLQDEVSIEELMNARSSAG